LGHVGHTKEIRNTYKILIGKTEGKISFGRPRRRGKEILKMGLYRYRDTDWIQPAYDRIQWRVLVSTVINLRIA
jgi:hypothetical protein